MSTSIDSQTDESTSRGDVERYGLMAAVTLLIVLFLVVDEQRATATTPPPADRDGIVVLELGGREVPVADLTQRRRLGADIQADPGRDPEPVDRAPLPAPPEPEPTPPNPGPSGPRTVVVQPGDSLSRISERELGTVRRMGEILELNGLRDANSLQAGQSLRLPPR